MAFLYITSVLLAFMCIIINKTTASFPDTQQQYVGHNKLDTPAITQRDKIQERVTSSSVYLKRIYQDPNYELNGANEITALLPIPFTSKWHFVVMCFLSSHTANRCKSANLASAF